MGLPTTLALLTLSLAVPGSPADGPLALQGLRGPATEAPASEAPATEAPAPEGPATEAPAADPTVDQPSTPPASPETEASGASAVGAALEAGDLTGALELARTQREAEPSAATWAKEAEVLEAKGHWAGAMSAWREARSRAEDDASRAQYESRIEALDARARGSVEGEPASTHRAAIDAERAAREAANQPAPIPQPEPEPEPPKRERIVTKWYFWVTVAAITASAGAITGIAIKSAVDERKRSGHAPAMGSGVTVLRF